jgi:ethanolamine phosphate phosphodiesterase
MAHWPRNEDDEQAEEDMHPAQYALRRDRHYSNGDWSPSQDDDHLNDIDQVELEEAPEGKASYFLHVPSDTNRRRWSWTFVFRGRRRRMSLHKPSMSLLRSTADILAFGGSTRSNLLLSVLGDIAAVGWVTIIAWMFFGWYMT